MIKGQHGDLLLPNGWEEALDVDGKPFYIDHNMCRTTWIDPRDRYTKPECFADCVGDELPIGWEEVVDPTLGVYFVDHINQANQFEDPRLQWRHEQQQMLTEYLVTARDDLQSKKDMYDIKAQRLRLAQDEFNNLNDTFYSKCCNSSHTSLTSNSSSGSNKYDQDFIKSEINQAKKRVSCLRAELEQIRAEVHYKQQGMKTLSSVGEKLCTTGGFNFGQAQAIVSEIRQLQQYLISGQKERNGLVQDVLQSATQLNEEYCFSKPGGSFLDLSHLSQNKNETASQTELRGDFSFNQNRLLAEKIRLRLQYSEAQRRLSDLKVRLVNVEENIIPGQAQCDKDRISLFQEKEQLLRELCELESKSCVEEEKASLQQRVSQLETDLKNALHISNNQIEARLALEKEKTFILYELAKTAKLTSYVESQLRSLSLSTLSLSSGSSLGSLGSLSTNSYGSQNSLRMMDVYGQTTGILGPRIGLGATDINLERLCHRVDGLQHGGCMLQTGDLNRPNVAVKQTFVDSRSHHHNTVTGVPGEVNFSPHCSQAVARAVFSPHTQAAGSVPMPLYPVVVPPYSHHLCCQKMNDVGSNHIPGNVESAWVKIGTNFTPPTILEADESIGTTSSCNVTSMHNAVYQNALDVFSASSSSIAYAAQPIHSSSTDPHLITSQKDFSVDNERFCAQTSVSSLDLCPGFSKTLTDNMTSFHSSHSPDSINKNSLNMVINDSAKSTCVFTSVNEKLVGEVSDIWRNSVKLLNEHAQLQHKNLESAQIQVKLKYNGEKHLLSIGIEQARNLAVLPFHHSSKMCIKVSLVPCASVSWTTKSTANLTAPDFSEVFNVPVEEHHLNAKTLQLHVWALHDTLGDHCLGCAQVSLADFDRHCVSLRWYNVLNMQFMQTEQSVELNPPIMADHMRPNREENDKCPLPPTGNNFIASVVRTPVSNVGLNVSRDTATCQDSVHHLLEASSARLMKSRIFVDNKPVCSENGQEGQSSSNDNHACISLVEESSDESTIISSQTSTLTRDHVVSDMLLVENQKHEEESDECEEEDQQDYAEMIQDVLNELSQSADGWCDEHDVVPYDSERVSLCDAQTNTDGDVVGLTAKRRSHSAVYSKVRRSQTFSPACQQAGFICKLNRCDSDSSMPLYSRGPFNRNSLDRKSVRWKKTGVNAVNGLKVGGTVSSHLPIRTSFDLELDLQALHTRLSCMQDEIGHLHQLKEQLEKAKDKGDTELPSWLSENEKFAALISEARKRYSVDHKVSSRQDRRAEHLMMKTTRDIECMKQGSKKSIARSFSKIEVERVNQEKHLVEFAGYITLAGNQQ